MRTELTVGPDDAGMRLDAWLAARAGLSRALAARLIASGAVTVDGAAAAKSARVEAGMRVQVEREPEAAPAPDPVHVPVAFEDEWLVVVSKPAGLVVHPAPGHGGGTLVNALLARPGSEPVGGEWDRPGIVHRLDAGTSGLMVVAKDEEAHARLVEALSVRAVARAYLALVAGNPDTDTLTIDAPIGRAPRDRKKMAVVAGGKQAVTHVRVLERHGDTTLVEARLETGRTHQIRVHLAVAGHAVVGDPVYGRTRALARSLGLDRPFLHAARLAFDHPITGARIDLQDPLPEELESSLAAARERSISRRDGSR